MTLFYAWFEILKWWFWINSFFHWIEFSLSIPTHVYLRKSDIRARSYGWFKITAQLSISSRRGQLSPRHGQRLTAVWCPKTLFSRIYRFQSVFIPKILSKCPNSYENLPNLYINEIRHPKTHFSLDFSFCRSLVIF